MKGCDKSVSKLWERPLKAFLPNLMHTKKIIRCLACSLDIVEKCNWEKQINSRFKILPINYSNTSQSVIRIIQSPITICLANYCESGLLSGRMPDGRKPDGTMAIRCGLLAINCEYFAVVMPQTSAQARIAIFDERFVVFDRLTMCTILLWFEF